MKKLVLPGLLAALILVLAFSGLLLHEHSARTLRSATHAVVLGNDGFDPQSLTIKRGDTVVFSTTGSQPFWPASNPHPIHSDDPAFDPKRPIQPGETWSFTFADAGTFGFHNHLDSPVQGKIIVTP